jgi:ribulose-5-phosphate 4-epimerase/fuculose-1-phosphate aldolase
MTVEALVRRAPPKMSAEEWQLRLELAACYRLFAFLGWFEMIYNHITVRVPGPEPQYLINPFGLNYEEVTARNLVKVDTKGKVLDGSTHPINLAGFIIHSAIHSARPDAHCIMHTHTTAGCAVAGKEEGLRPDNFYSAMLHGSIAYHDFEGVTTVPDEQPRLVKSLGDKSILILRNHGLLVVGAHVPEALNLHWTLQRACEVQLATDSMAGPNRKITPEVLAETPARRLRENADRTTNRRGQTFFDALMRRAKLRLDDIAGD